MADNALALSRPDASTIPSPQDWKMMMDMAGALVPTGFLPDSIKNPQQAVAIMLKGRELGVPTMYALSNISVVKGKPTVSAEMMLALIYRDHGKKAIRVKESTNDHCTIEYRLPGWDVASYTFTMNDAAKAGLANTNTWKSYPAAMLRARCISAVARMAFPESIAGIYVPGELGEDVTVNDAGEVVSVASVPSAATVVVDHNTGEITDGITPFDDLVGVCNDAGIDADMLDRWAESKGLGSHEHITDQWARKLAMTLRDSEQADRFKAQFGDTPAVEAKVSDVPPMFGDDEFAALNEEADRAVAAARARA